MEDRENFDRPVVVNDNQIEALVQNNPGHTTREIEDIVQISNMSFVRYLKNTWKRESLRCLGASQFNRKN